MLVLHAALDGGSLLFWTEPEDDVDGALDRAGLTVRGERVEIRATLPAAPSSPLVGKMKRGPKEALRTRDFLPVLLAGEMPQDIESVLEQKKVSLFPSRQSDLTTECSCPDWSNPCKHIAAVYYLLGEEFDRDPFLLLQVRGLPRESLTTPTPPLTSVGVRPQLKLTDFWEGARPALDLIGDIDPRGRLALLERLGPFPFWRGEQPLADVVTPILEEAAGRATMILVS